MALIDTGKFAKQLAEQAAPLLDKAVQAVGGQLQVALAAFNTAVAKLDESIDLMSGRQKNTNTKLDGIDDRLERIEKSLRAKP